MTPWMCWTNVGSCKTLWDQWKKIRSIIAFSYVHVFQQYYQNKLQAFASIWLCFQTSMQMQHTDLSFKCLALTWVIWPLEKSKTSSLSSLRMTMLFWQRLSLVRLAPTMSLIKVGQCLGHSCFKIYKQVDTDIGVTWFRNDIFHWEGHVIWKWKIEGMNL